MIGPIEGYDFKGRLCGKKRHLRITTKTSAGLRDDIQTEDLEHETLLIYKQLLIFRKEKYYELES
jgi:hypothetical protein